MIQQATKGILSVLILFIAISALAISQDHSKSKLLMSQPIITQDDLFYYHDLQDQGLMTSKELIEFDRIMVEISSDPQKMDYRSIGVIDLSRTNRNIK